MTESRQQDQIALTWALETGDHSDLHPCDAKAGLGGAQSAGWLKDEALAGFLLS